MENRARLALEAALASAWDRETLAVYADHLQAEGDPRGELIALDLEIEAHGSTAELSKRRTSLLYAWLGALVPVDNVHAAWVGDSLRFGFVDDLRYESSDANALTRLEQVLASPAGPYLRGITLRGTTRDLEPALRALARHEHPWLVRMSIGLYHADATIDPDVARAAFHAMPRLETLELVPNAALGPFSHPSIKKLVVRSAAVYAALGDGATFDGVTDLTVDLSNVLAQWEYDEEYEVDAPERPPVPKLAFPSLRRLDLSANPEPSVAYALLRTLDARAHVTHLVISQLRYADDRDDLVAAIRDMRALEVVEVARGSYFEPPGLPGVRLVHPEPWPWPPPEDAWGRALRVYPPGARHGETVAIVVAAYQMERAYETMPRPARAAWSQFWKLAATLTTAAAEFPAQVLAEAVDACPDMLENGWRELREELAARRPFAPDAMVRVERCTA